MKVEYVTLDKIKAYGNNAKLHPAWQVEQIKESIKKFGFNDPIAIDADGPFLLLPLRQMVRHRVLVPIIAGSNPAGAVPPWLSWKSNRLVSGRLWVQIPPAA